MNERRIVGNPFVYTSLIAALASHAYTLFQSGCHPNIVASDRTIPTPRLPRRTHPRLDNKQLRRLAKRSIW